MTYLNFQMIGDHQVGKTALINAYTAFIFRDEFYPNILDFYTKHFFYKDEGIVLNIFDLSGCAAEYRKIRLYQFDNIDVFLVCFSIDIKQSLENAEKKWIPEIKEICPGIPFILVGTKSELSENLYQNENEKIDLISSKAGKYIAKKTDACCYIECSSKKRINVDELFEKAIEIALNSRYKKIGKNRTKNKNCVIF